MRTTKAVLEANLAIVSAQRDELLETNAVLEARIDRLESTLTQCRTIAKRLLVSRAERTAQRDAARERIATLEASIRNYDTGLAVTVDKLKDARADAERLRTICAEWAHQSKVDARTIARLKAHAPKPVRSIEDFASKCREYCEQNGVRSVPAEIIREWRNHA